MSVRLWMELSIRADRPKMIFELDDDLWSIHPTNPAYKDYDEDTLYRLQRCIEASDAVTVSTEPLAQVVRRYNQNVYVLPNYIDSSLLDLPRRRPESNGETRIGWAGGHSHSNDFSSYERGIAKVVRETGSKLVMMGWNFTDDRMKELSTFIPYDFDIPSFHRTVARNFDIGIAPLANTKFNRSKSDLKMKEYMALGIPGVYSRVQPYSSTLKDGKGGFLVDNSSELAKRLKLLVKDEDLRNRMGKEARDIAADFTIQKNVYRWDDVITEVLNS